MEILSKITRNSVGGNKIFNCRGSMFAIFTLHEFQENGKFSREERTRRNLSLMKFKNFVLVIADKMDGRHEHFKSR